MRTLIQSAPPSVCAAMVLLPLAMAGVAVFAGFHARRQAQIVKSTKTVPIGMADDGYRQFEGTAEPIGGQTVIAPLTGSECVWYSATVEEFKRSPTSSTHKAEWVTVKSLTSTAPILVRDNTGACVVRVYGAEVTPRDKSRWTGASLEPEDRNPPRLGPQESLNPMVQMSGGPSHRFRYTETRIYAGDPLLVTGVFESHRFDTDGPDLDELPPDPSIAPGWQPSDDEDEPGAAQDAGAAGAGAAGPSGLTWHAANSERTDTLDTLAASVTKAEISLGGRGQPLIVAATSAATHVYMNEMGSQAAFMVALVPLGIAALVLLARWG